MYYSQRFRLWRARMKLRLAVWLVHRVEAHIESVLLDTDTRGFALGAGFLSLFAIEAGLIFFH